MRDLRGGGIRFAPAEGPLGLPGHIPRAFERRNAIASGMQPQCSSATACRRAGGAARASSRDRGRLGEKIVLHGAPQDGVDAHASGTEVVREAARDRERTGFECRRRPLRSLRWFFAATDERLTIPLPGGIRWPKSRARKKTALG